MKKLIVLGIMLLGIVAKAEKLTTDGKDHLKELLGKWGEPAPVYIVLKDQKLYFIDQEDNKNSVGKYNSYTFVINYSNGMKTCFAYDTKKKALALLNKCGSDEVFSYIPKLRSSIGG